MSILPANRPKASSAVVIGAAMPTWRGKHDEPWPAVCVVGVRGYYRASAAAWH